jgi:hypothetical protein
MAKSKKPKVTSFATAPTIGGYAGPRNVTPAAPDLGLGKITTPIPINIGGSTITLPAPSLTPVQRTPVAPSLPPAQRTPVVSSKPTVNKSEEKKPLEWGFKGRKKTDILNEDPNDYTNVYREWNKLSKVAKEKPNTSLGIWLNNRIYDVENASPTTEMVVKKDIINSVNGEFKLLENEGVPRELTGKMFGNQLGMRYLNGKLIKLNYTYGDKIKNAELKKDNKEVRKIIQQKNIERDRIEEDWEKGWLRYYNELDKSQKETFQVLSDDWKGSPNELVDAVKALGRYDSGKK